MGDVLLKELRSIATALGISTEGKSAKDLSALIKGVGQKPQAPSTSFIDPNALSKHFEEGRFTDCTIRVKIRESDEYASDRPSKRLRSEEGKGAEINMPVGGGEDPHALQAHAVILASRSAYFERAMGGEWRESQDRSFEVEVADETEYVTFRRLIKLCYGTTFIKEGDRDLDVSELVRLIHVANAFECMDAVRQCTVALQGMELDWEGAVQCLELTEMLKGVEGMGDLAKKAAEVLAKEVGPVDELFVPAEEEKDAGDGGDVLGRLRLSARVKALSPAVFEPLLSSEGLQLKTENEAFWLLLAWVKAQSEQSEEGKQELFNRMAKHLRFHAMDPGYILLMVSEHPRIIAAGLQGQILMDSLIRANLARRVAEQVDHMDTQHGFKLLSGRAPSGKVSWTKDMTFTASDIAEMTSGDARCHKSVGLVAGIPWRVQLWRDEAETQQAAVLTGCKPPRGVNCIDSGRGPRGFFFTYCLKAGATRRRNIKPSSDQGVSIWTTTKSMWGGDVGAWEEVFAEGSEWLRDGGLDVKVTITTCNDQGALDE